jgi:hypothetical protein
MRLVSVSENSDLGLATLTFGDRRARLRIYADHPSYSEVGSYKGRACTYDYDSKRVLRDFYSEADATRGLRELLTRAGAVRSHQASTRAGLAALLRVHAASDDPAGEVRRDPFSALRAPPDEQLYDMETALRLADLLGLPPERKCLGHMQYHIRGLEGKGGGGNTCYPRDWYLRKFAGLYGRGMSQAALAELLGTRRLRAEGAVLMSPRAERHLRDLRGFLGAADGPGGPDPRGHEGLGDGGDGEPLALTAEQRAAVRSALTRSVTVVVGCAGCGKTVVVESLKRAAGARAVVCAPTGKAARRAGGVTVHSLLFSHEMSKGGGGASPLPPGSARGTRTPR